MPWSKSNLPKVALNWTADEQARCIKAANAALENGSEEQAIFACIRAAGKSEVMADFMPIQRTCQNCKLLPGCDHAGEPCKDWKLNLGADGKPDYQALKQREKDIIMNDFAQVTTAQVSQGGSKLTQEQANYRRATGSQKCSNCRFFSNGACSVVAGDISPDYTSDEWRAVQEQASESFLIAFEKGLRDDILIFPVGTFYRDGAKRTFTREMGAQMVRNFRDNILERKKDGWLPVNAEHERRYGRIADLVALYQDDDGNVRGKPHDPDGKLAGFDYFSPEVRWQWTHPHTGQTYQNVLMGGGATNYPFFLGKMALHQDEVAIAKSADLPLVWTGSEWEQFSMDKPLPGHVLGRIIKTAIEALGMIKALALGGQEMEEDEQEEDEDEMPMMSETDFTHTVQFAAADSDKRIVTGVNFEPGVIDMHGHLVSAEDIEAAAHNFMSKLQLDAHHDRLIQSDKAKVVESWIQKDGVTWKMKLPDGSIRTTEVKPGSWCMSVQILDDELWSEVQDGRICGFSPSGVAIAQELRQNT